MAASVNTKQSERSLAACCLSSGTNKREEKLVIGLIAAVALVTLAGSVSALYIPDNQVLRFQVMSSRRQDADDDSDLDRGASAPYQNQNDGQRSTDGYEDNEPEGPYDETPRDEEGQADLERFFDDHLGASEKDGMDQENLPTELRPLIVNLVHDLETAADTSNGDFQTIKLAPSYPGSSSSPSLSYLNNIYSNNQQQPQPQPLESILPNVETSFIKLPNQKLIITRQITRGPVYKGGLDLSHVPAILKYHRENDNESENDNETRNKNAKRGERLDAKGSDVVATENDDTDRVYVTNMTNKPFKIAQLGGYDPEEDFQDASRDFEDSERRHRGGNRSSSRGKPDRGENENQAAGAGSRTGNNDQGPEQQPTRDISFNDEADTLFNDASETDEVFFKNDPYTTDLEAELRGEQQAAGEQVDAIPEQARSAADEEEREERQPEAEASHKRHEKVPKRGAGAKDDEAEGSWVNDGVEDMEVPSQSYQDEVLEKAAAAQEAAAADARRAAGDAGDGMTDADEQPAQDQEQADQGYRNDGPQENQEPTQNQDPTDMRMPNADYLKEDMNVDGPNDMLR